MEKYRILLVNDNLSHRVLIKELLSPLNAEVIAGSIEVCRHHIHNDTRFELVISQLKRNHDGSKVLMPLREGSYAIDVPIIFTGSSEAEEDIRRGLAFGASAYMDISEVVVSLLPLVEKLLKKTSETAKGKSILVVDDSNAVRLLLKEGLAKEGYQVLTAEDGKKALEVIRNAPPDLILSDVYMPEMNGLELCENLHGNPLYSHIPFVVMSTENKVENMKHMMQHGAAAFIIKPFNLEQLMITLNKIFSYEFLLLLKEKERLSSERKLLIAGITSLVKALEARDKYTRGHSDRVSLILSGLVKYSGGTSRDIERAEIAGRLHDIGKIGIKDNVLLKPGRLTQEEFDQIKQHPIIGSSIIQTIPSISDIVPVVYSHHERIDGKGYPIGLKGTDIPLWARMTAVADTYDALTSDRPYRKSMNHDKAIEIIKDVSGSQLCSISVGLFFEWWNNEQPDIITQPDKRDTSLI